MIPVANPGAAYRAQQAEIDAAIARVLASDRYILGPEVDAFEREFATYLGATAAVGVASGTDALELALRGCGIGPGDTVFASAFTAGATITAIERAGASPYLVDIDPRTYAIDAYALRDAVARWRATDPAGRGAVVVVHLYGCPADVDRLAVVADQSGLVLIEDCAQATGAAVRGRRVGTWGHAAAFSFYPTKNLGAIGDGGAVVTMHEDVADRVRALREYGWRARHVSDVPGQCSRLDELQAAVLRVKLRALDDDNARRIALAKAYVAGLECERLRLPVPASTHRHVYHLFVVAVHDREAVRHQLHAAGVATAVHYPVPIHLQPAYRDRIMRTPRLTEAERAARDVLSLPMYPQLPHTDVEIVCAALMQRNDRRPSAVARLARSGNRRSSTSFG